MTDRGHGDVAGSKWHPIAIALVSTIIGSSGGVALVYNTDLGQSITRPDPFTGAQGGALEQRIDRLEKDIDEHVLRHPDEINQFDRRIATLEAQYAIILANQARILDRLDQK